MAHSRIWQPYSPLFADFMEDGAEEIEHLREDVYERMAVDHIMGSPIATEPTSPDFDGYHNKATLNKQNSILISNYGASDTSPNDTNVMFVEDNEKVSSAIDLSFRNYKGATNKIVEAKHLAKKYYKPASRFKDSIFYGVVGPQSVWQNTQGQTFTPLVLSGNTARRFIGMPKDEGSFSYVAVPAAGGIYFVQAWMCPTTWTGTRPTASTSNPPASSDCNYLYSYSGYLNREADFWGYRIRYVAKELYYTYGTPYSLDEANIDIRLELVNGASVLSQKLLWDSDYGQLKTSYYDRVDEYRQNLPSMSCIAKLNHGECIDFKINAVLTNYASFTGSRLAGKIYYVLMRLA